MRRALPRLQGKVALITGGGRGIGAAVARAFANEGARVLICDILVEGQALAEEIGEAASFHRLNVSDERAWQALATDIEEAPGAIDLPVNNAGVVFASPILDLSKADFERVLQVNLLGMFLGMKTVGGAMARRGSGSIMVKVEI